MKKLEQKKIEFEKKHIQLSMQASFPDSGYYYSQISNKRDALYDEIKSSMNDVEFNEWFNRIEKNANIAHFDYNEKIVFTNDKGQEFTACDMDELMTKC